MSKLYRTRFAPSPTGQLHIGGARTCLINYLIAQRSGGSILLRIDDSDSARSDHAYERDIIDSLSWLGFGFNSQQRQSERHNIYEKYFQLLIKKGACYRDETLSSKQHTQAFRIKIPRHTKITWHDRVYGGMSIDTNTLEDYVIRRSDGSFTYQYCCVIDDIEDRINLVVRGSDHLYNTAKQIILFNWIDPDYEIEFCHIPLLLNVNGSKISKRDKEKLAITHLRHQGFVKDAINNYLASSSWSSPDILLTMDEMIDTFSLDKIRSAQVKVDLHKLIWYNRTYLRQASYNKFITYWSDYTQRSLFCDNEELISYFVKRINYLSELEHEMNFLHAKDILYNSKKDITNAHLNALITLTVQNHHIIDQIPHIKDKSLLQHIRYALTGCPHTPPLPVIIQWLGDVQAKRRIKNYLQYMQHA